MQTIRMSSHGRSDTSCFTDCCIAPARGAILLSLVGNDSSVKAVSAMILEKRRSWEGLYLEDNSFVTRYKDANYNCITSKVTPGVIHMLIVDRRFYEATDDGTRLLFLKADEKAHEIVFERVLKSVATPLLPEWSSWIYDQLTKAGRAKEIQGYGGKAVAVKVDEEFLDKLVSEGVTAGEIGW